MSNNLPPTPIFQIIRNIFMWLALSGIAIGFIGSLLGLIKYAKNKKSKAAIIFGLILIASIAVIVIATALESCACVEF